MFRVNSDGSIELIRGDSGSIGIRGLKLPKNSTEPKLVMSIYTVENVDEKPLTEMVFDVNKIGDDYGADIFIPSHFTDSLRIPSNQDFVEYYYAFKLCYKSGLDEVEETLTKDGEPSTQSPIVVYRKRAEGYPFDKTGGNDA